MKRPAWFGKVLSMAMTFAMVSSFHVSATAWADEPDAQGAGSALGTGYRSGAVEGVASVDRTGFETLQKAVDAAPIGGTVVLQQDTDVTAAVTIGKSLTLDLNGHAVSGTSSCTVYAHGSQGEANVVIRNGTIVNSSDAVPHAVVLARYGVCVKLENAKLTDAAADASGYGYGILAGQAGDASTPAIVLEGDETVVTGSLAGIALFGCVSDPTSLEMNGGTVSGWYYGIAGNGSSDGVDIVVNGGKVAGLNRNDSKGIYHPQDGNLTVRGGSIEGAGGIQVIGAGIFRIEGGTIVANADEISPSIQSGDGSVGDGAALSVVSRGGEYGAAGSAEIVLTGGTLKSVNNTALLEYGVSGASSLAKSIELSQGGGEELSVAAGAGKPAVRFNLLTDSRERAITGGVFSSDVQAYCAEGYRSQQREDGAFEVVDDREAAIGDVRYATLHAALNDAKDGDTVTLLRDIDTSERLSVRKDITLDLGGNTYTGSHASGPLSVVDSVLTMRNGTFAATNPDSIAIYIQNAKLVLDEGASIKAAGYGVQVGNLYNSIGYRGDCVVNAGASIEAANGCGVYVVGYYARGEASDGSLSPAQNVRNTLTVNGGTVKVAEGNKFAAVSGNGSKHGTAITINSGTVSGGTTNAGVYHPQLGELIVSGGLVEGTAGVEMRAGTLYVSGEAQIVGTIMPTIVNPNGSGGTTDGAGVAVAQHTTRLPIEVSVSGGAISGFSALYESNPQQNSSEDLAKVKLSVAGGTLSAINGGTLAVHSEDMKDFITGGTFNSVLDEAYYDEAVYSQNALDVIDDPGAVVPRAYAVSYDLAGGTLQEGASNPVSYTYFDDDVVLANPSKVGYAFAGWTGTDLENAATNVTIAKNSTGDRSYVATWTPNANTAYAVEHYFQNVEGDGYTLDAAKTQSLSGTTDAETSAVALEVAGFTAKAVSQKMIAGDGSTVVEIRYDRNVHTLSYAYVGMVPDGASALPDDRQLRYGAPVATAAQATAPGYTFGGWGVAEGYTMPDEDVELTGSFTANGDTAYRVEHYRQSLDGVYQLVAADELEGMTDSAVTAAPKTFTGFSYREDAPGSLASGAVKGDGSLVLKLFYDRNSYEVSYAYAGAVPVGAPAVPQTTSVAYGATVEPAAVPTMTGYTFSGWSKDVAFEMPAEKVVITGSWAANADVRYTVHYFLDGTDTKLADDKLVGERTFGQTYEEAALDIAGYTVKGSKVQQVTLDAYDKEATFFYTADEARIAFEANGGSRVDDLVGVTGAPVRGSLPAPTRVGYAFAGWYADKALTVPVTQLPAVFEAGATTYYAKWNAVPLPDADVEIQVELPQASGDGSAYAAVPDEAVRAAAEHAQKSLESIGNGEVPAGMSAQDAQAVADVLEAAGSDDTVSVVISLRFEEKGASDVEEGEQQAIGSVVNDSEGVALYLDLGVEMTVKVVGDEGVKDQRTVSLNEVSTPLLFEIHVNPDLVKGKHVRIAHVHEEATEIIYPESVDREQGIVRFYASAFSTYALLTSDTVSVTFESNGGTAIEAQTLKLGEKASKPVGPKREGFAFGGWFSDEALTMAYDFAVPVDRSMTLYAKWTAISAGGGSGSGGDDAVVDDDGAKPSSKPLPQAQVPKKLVATGDGTGRLAASSFALVVLAAAAIVVAAKPRRARG